MRHHFMHSIAIVAALSAAAAAGTVARLSPPRDTLPLAEINAPASIEHLRRAYGLTITEAKRRLVLQQNAEKIATDLAARFPGQFGGMWIDQAHGGVLLVAATDPAALIPTLRAVPDSIHIRTIRVERSLRQLNATATAVAQELGTTVGTDVSVDERANQVVITTGRRISPTDTRLPRLLGLGVRAESRASGTVEKSCDPLHCFVQPMRGGIRIDVPRDDGSVGGCTTGFNLRSGLGRYILTAGHCVGSATHTHTDTTSHDGHPVGVEDKTLVNVSYPTDYAVMPYQDGAMTSWFGRRANEGLVNAYCPGGCTGSRDVEMTGFLDFSAVQLGWIVCAAGAGYTPQAGEDYVDSGAGLGYKPGVRCGEVFSKADGGIGVRICARKGDSGGPLFVEASRKALGILTQGDPGTGACTNPSERNYYSPISKILADANGRWAGADFTLGAAPTVVPRRDTF